MNHRALIIIYPFIILIILSVAVISSAKDKASQTKDAVTSVALKNFPPQYMINEDGSPGGFAIDVMDEIAQIAGIRILSH